MSTGTHSSIHLEEHMVTLIQRVHKLTLQLLKLRELRRANARWWQW